MDVNDLRNNVHYAGGYDAVSHSVLQFYSVNPSPHYCYQCVWCLSKCNILILVFVLGFAGTDTIVTFKCYCQFFLQFIDISHCTCPNKQFLWGGGKFIVLLVANKCHPLALNCSELDMFGVCRNTLSLKCSGRWCRHWTQICNGSFSSECAQRLKSVKHKSQDDFANDICFVCFTLLAV
jgi:hypothetical protein